MSKIRVTVYVPAEPLKQVNVLTAFARGIPNARVRPLGSVYEPCDVAVVFGLVKRANPLTWPKRQLLKKHQGDRLIVIDSAFLHRGEYYNVGFGGINGNADFKNERVRQDRWQALNIRAQPWRENPSGSIVVCGQVPWDTAVQDTNHAEWCRSTVEYYSKRGVSVRFRPHPRVRDRWRRQYPGIPERLVSRASLADDIKDARMFVTWNSNAAVDAAIQGVPIIAMDKGSGAYSVASHSLDAYLDPYCPPRYDWFAGLGYAQWTLEEMQLGLPWKHLMGL